jgi:hypothetical protein
MVTMAVPFVHAGAQSPTWSASRSGVMVGGAEVLLAPEGEGLCLGDRVATVVYSGVVGAVVGWVTFLAVDALAPGISGDVRGTIRRRWIRASFFLGTAQGLRQAMLRSCDQLNRSLPQAHEEGRLPGSAVGRFAVSASHRG